MGLFHSPKIVTNGLVLALDAGNVKSINPLGVQGQSEFTTPGSYTWTAPASVTSVCVVCIGAGGAGGAYGGGGGSLAYKNNISVTPGQSYSVEVGASNTATNETGGLVNTYAGLSSAFGTYAFGGRGGNTGGSSSQGIGGNYDGGGEGGSGSSDFYQSGPGYKGGCGGGAGGYSGDGGDAGYGISNGADGSGGGGGGGASSSNTRSFGGGGVGIYGEGASGSGGVPVYNGGTGIGGGGSGGEDSIARAGGSAVTGGGLYGGGGGGGNNSAPVTTGSNSGGGAVRIIWGSGRSFPSTNTMDVTPVAQASNNWTDLMGNTNGTLTNGPTYSSDDGGSIGFDGNNDFVEISSGWTNFGTDPFTIEVWYKTSSASQYETLVGNASGGSGTFQLDYNASNNLRFQASTNSGEYVDSSISLSVGVWKQVVIVREGTGTNQFKIYSNGDLNTTGTFNIDLNSSAQLRIGRNRGGVYYYDGEISNVKAYKGKALTAVEVLQNYNALKGRYA